MLNASRTPIDGLLIVEPVVHEDSRGCFVETFRASDFALQGIREPFVQDNYSLSRRGVLRGLHFQLPPYAQSKLIRAISGSIWDVAVDLRHDSPTYGRWFGIELSARSRKMFYVPAGFAHGFVALEDGTEVEYKCSAEHERRAETGIRWNDPEIGIDWGTKDVILSARDATLPFLRDL
jgi:dTDP-4-dehydrorhamnose 3,5-epimerase